MSYGELLVYITSYFGLFTTLFFLLTYFEKKKRDYIRHESSPNVCIIVPCYNEEIRVTKTLNSLLALDYPKDKLEIIAVDDGSTDNTLSVLKRYKPRGIQIFHQPNEGKHSALNLGLQHTSAEFVGALDADSFVDKFALKRILSRFTTPDIMAVTPAMLITKPKGVLRRIQAIEFFLGIFLREVFTKLGSQHVTPGPFTIYRKQFFDNHGFYKKAHNTEDMEVALRINKHHYLIENSPTAYVYTHGPSTFKKLYHQRLRWYNGFLCNLWDYRELLSTKHGNLGVFILPVAFISVILSLLNFFNALTIIFTTFFERINNLIAIQFDVFPVTVRFDSFYIATNSVLIISLMSALVGVAMILIAKKLVQQRASIKLSFIFFFFFYAILFSYWWSMVLLYKLFKFPIAWNHKGSD